MPAGSHRPGGLTVRLLRLQYWYDRLSEPQRLLAGLGAIAFLGTSWLYVLGLGSWVLVNRAEQFDASRTGTVTQAPPIVATVQSAPAATTVRTPAIDTNTGLIPPPDVPEVAIVPQPPRYVAPVVPIKPRVIETTPVPVVPAVPTPAPARPGAISTPLATPVRTAGTAGRTNGTSISSTPTPVRTVPPGPTPIPTRPGGNVVTAPTLAPTTAPTATQRR
jgi:hypothetical protein